MNIWEKTRSERNLGVEEEFGTSKGEWKSTRRVVFLDRVSTKSACLQKEGKIPTLKDGVRKSKIKQTGEGEKSKRL